MFMNKNSSLKKTESTVNQYKKYKYLKMINLWK